MSGDTGSYPNAFSDVPSSAWYEKGVAWAAAKGIVNGVGDNRFAPESAVSREQMVVLLFNYAKYAGIDVSKVEGTSIREFSDYGSISSWALAPVQWAINNGIVSGNGNGGFEPQTGTTRAEVAKMIAQYLQGVAK